MDHFGKYKWERVKVTVCRHELNFYLLKFLQIPHETLAHVLGHCLTFCLSDRRTRPQSRPCVFIFTGYAAVTYR